jgi:acyl-phosphate glycerol 3-phosphate acyltransferase
MTIPAQLTILILSSYLLGAVPFGYLVSRMRGVDILIQGSGNIGATNVGRVLGKPLGALVFVLDFLKGAVPTALGPLVTPIGPQQITPQTVSIMAGLAAMIGHMFPIFLRFRGGKGVATGSGVLLVLLPIPVAVACLTWLAMALATRYVSLASLTASIVLCVTRSVAVANPWDGPNGLLTLFCFAAATLVWIRHKDNLRRLIHGNENRLRDSSSFFMLGKCIHIFALSLWFGSSVFFSFVAAPVIFKSYRNLAEQPTARPDWFPHKFDKEEASRLAGIALDPVFPRYFILQGACAVLALSAAIPWKRAKPGARLHRWRCYFLIAALLGIIVGWPIAAKAGALRSARYAADPAVAAAANEDFPKWHSYSLLLNFVTVAFVSASVALMAKLPEFPDEPLTAS